MQDQLDLSGRHVGPLTTKDLHTGETPVTLYEVATQEGTAFAIDKLLHQAIAFCINPTADLWIAYESDRELQPQTGEWRGWLRLELTTDLAKLAPLTGWAGAHFPFARLVTNAKSGQVPFPTVGYRTTNYQAEALRNRGGYAKQDTRDRFIQLCATLARHRNSDLAADWEAQAMVRFTAADAFHEELAALEKEIEGEDNPTTIATAPQLEGPATEADAA